MIYHINQRKDKSYMIPIDAQKAFDKIQNLFMIKSLIKISIEGTYLNMLKTIYNKPNRQIVSGEKATSLPAEFRNKSRCPLSTTSIQHNIGNPNSSQTRKRGRRYPEWKGGDKTTIVCT